MACNRAWEKSVTNDNGPMRVALPQGKRQAPEDAMNTNLFEQRVLPHHQTPASIWGQGGSAYDDISFGISDALAHTAQRLSAKPKEQVLDVATGTG
jgi:hypothetical protein